jgi:uncharacterized protein
LCRATSSVVIVSNSSPLILFAKIGRLELLKQAYDEVIIPQAVYAEVVTARAGQADAAVVAATPWITVKSVSNAIPWPGPVLPRNAGEAEVVALALEFDTPVPVLIDDRLGRRVAHERDLQVFGSASTLIRAKQRGAIPEVRPVLGSLLAAGLYLGTSVYREILVGAGEAAPP